MSTDIKKWHEIGNKLTARLRICQCERKLKSWVDTLLSIKKVIDAGAVPEPWHWAMISMLNSVDLLSHGSNMEHSWLNDDEFWAWLEEIKDSPDLEDN